MSLYGKLPVLTIVFDFVSKMNAAFDGYPSFLPPKIMISVAEMGHAPNQYFVSFSKLFEYTLISSQKGGCAGDIVSSLSMSVTAGSYPPKT